MISIFVVSQNADLCEGRGPMVHKGYFVKREDAVEFSHTLSGIMGTRSGVNVEMVVLCETLDDHAEYRKEQIKRRAIDKLTDEELEVLGLDSEIKVQDFIDIDIGFNFREKK